MNAVKLNSNNYCVFCLCLSNVEQEFAIILCYDAVSHVKQKYTQNLKRQLIMKYVCKN